MHRFSKMCGQLTGTALGKVSRIENWMSKYSLYSD